VPHSSYTDTRQTTVRSILHVDMDAFYASVEEREKPEIAGRPLIVGGTPQGRGVVAAANYAVRKFGVHSAMPTATALRLCPHAVVLPPRMEYYAAVSRQIRDIFEQFTPHVEPLSLDEAFLDVTGSEALFGNAEQIGRKIKQEIAGKLRLVASVGVAPNKFLAKVASDLQKPDGFVVVDPARVQEFLAPLPVRRLWGVGKVAATILEELGVCTIGDIRTLPLETLQQRFGEHGRHLWELARGMDERPVVPDREAKSISHETTFPEDVTDLECLRAWAVELAGQVARRLRRHKLQGKTVHLKVRFSDFRTISRSTTLSQPTSVTHEIEQAIGEMLSSRLPAGHLPVRLLGVGVSGFDRPAVAQLTLFDQPKSEQSSHVSLDRTADEIRDRFGAAAIGRGSSLLYRASHTPQPRPESPARED
jgi:DNA polymerase IV